MTDDLLDYADELRTEIETLRSQVCDLWDAEGGAGGRAYLLGRAAERGEVIAWMRGRGRTYWPDTPERRLLERLIHDLEGLGPTAPLAYPDQLRAENERLRAALKKALDYCSRPGTGEINEILAEALGGTP